MSEASKSNKAEPSNKDNAAPKSDSDAGAVAPPSEPTAASQPAPTQATSMDLKNPDLMESDTNVEDAAVKADGSEPDVDSPTEVAPTESSPTQGASTKSKRRKRGEVLDISNVRIGILGSGKMATAIVKALTVKHDGKPFIDPKRIHVSKNPKRDPKKKGQGNNASEEEDPVIKNLGCYITYRHYDLFARKDCDVFFFCFHGNVIRQCYQSGGTQPLALTTNYIPNMRHKIFFLSLVGGIPLDQLKKCLLNPEYPEKYRLQAHRLMINTAVTNGNGLIAIDIEPDSKNCAPIVRDLLTSFGTIEFIGEEHMDIACAVGGCGLAFVYYFINAMGDGAFKVGLKKDVAWKLASRTLKCAALSVLESNKHPLQLRDQCTSPSGPAIYGIQMLEKKDCASGIASAIDAAYKRIKEQAIKADN